VQVLGTVKNAALVIFCVVFLSEQVTLVQGTGYTVALLGFSWYQYIKTRGPGPASGAKSTAGILSGSSRMDLMTEPLVKPRQLTGDGSRAH
jgi:hypothetical protein